MIGIEKTPFLKNFISAFRKYNFVNDITRKPKADHYNDESKKAIKFCIDKF